jgi:short-subunit dehydrogenase
MSVDVQRVPYWAGTSTLPSVSGGIVFESIDFHYQYFKWHWQGNVTRAMLPHFRARKEGRIITVTSVGGLVAFPLFTLYHASKWAVEGFMESLQNELRQFNIKVKLVEPGSVNTQFASNTLLLKSAALTDYDFYVEKIKKNLLAAAPDCYDPPLAVAQTIMKAATDRSSRLRYPVGNARLVLALRRWLPFPVFQRIVSSSNER